MTRLFRETDCPETPISGWDLGVVGYGNQGRAHALNLRDSGYSVLVGAEAGRPSAVRAEADGFVVVPPAALAAAADLVAVLVPDEHQRAVVAGIVGAASAPGLRVRAWVFAHGFALLYDAPSFPPGADVLVVAPAGPGVQVRTRYESGSGVPALLAVERDGSGQAEARARAYAAAIGAARAGLVATTVREEVEIDLFGEQAVLCGGMNALTQAAFQTLVDAGYAPEAAYLECVHQLRLTAELVERYGIEGMRRRISTTALFGDLSRGPRIGRLLREPMGAILAEVRSGAFAREWAALRASRPDWARRAPEEAREAEIERAGEVVRGLFLDPEAPEKR